MATQTEIPVFALFSIGHYALIRIEDYDKEQLKKHGAHWNELDEIHNLVLDQNQMVIQAGHF